ncbi:MAG TPA: J domain-containing protein [Streptosporangiaceae bacterium]|nr:J domain-containing protein [Streptosporangiaceae bacterium]
MAAADRGGSGPDLYQLLGVSREASRAEITLAWRRRARAEHPDARPDDVGAPDRFRALVQAWQVLGDPASRAAYDRSLARERQAPGLVRVTVRRPSGPGAAGEVQPLARVPGPPLRVGPVWVEGSRLAPRPDAGNEEDMRLAMLAELSLRFLIRVRGRLW